MATRVSVISICDLCGREDEQGFTIPVEISFSNPRSKTRSTYVVDACDACMTDHIDPLATSGHPVKRSSSKKVATLEPSDDPTACGFPGCSYTSARLQSLNAHKTKASHWNGPKGKRPSH